MKDWKAFVVEHGRQVRSHLLSAVVGVAESEIEHFRRTAVIERPAERHGFEGLFSLWHGRAPSDDEWPLPRRVGMKATYEWLGPEDRLLASLVGQVGVVEIGQILSERLRALTGDADAIRTKASVLVRQNKLGLQSGDVLGGIGVKAAAREIGSRAVVQHAIEQGELRTLRVGRLHVIPHAVWAAWKATRSAVPAGYVRVASLKGPLGMTGTDKLAEHCKAGHIPTAVILRSMGSQGGSSKFGTWYMDGAVAAQLIEDRKAGRPMPWHGKPYASNLRATWKLFVERRHPDSCDTCRKTWGEKGAPRTFEDYAERYPPLAHGEKRHLTRVYSDGLSVQDVAAWCGVSDGHVRRALRSGVLRSQGRRGAVRVTRTDATRWKARRCPAGDSSKSWISVPTAVKRYGFTRREIASLIASKRFKSKHGTEGAMRGIQYVLKQQCADLRADDGYTVEQGADRLGVTVEQLTLLLAGLDWRKARRIPVATLAAARKRLESRHGVTLDEAAVSVGKPLAWVEEQIRRGTVRVLRVKWQPDRLYLSDAMLERLRRAARAGVVHDALSREHWLLVDEASILAGVSLVTVGAWGRKGWVVTQASSSGMRYQRESVKACARRYWPQARFRRAPWPEWLIAEVGGRQAA